MNSSWSPRRSLIRIALALAPLFAASSAGAACVDLQTFVINGGKITSAVTVAAGAPLALSLFHITLPAPQDFCRVSATLTPTSDSVIMAEVWLPDPAKWNGKFLGAGNGGFGGSLSVPMFDMREALRKGYATAGNDLGHEVTTNTADGGWVIGHPEKMKDFAYRADHVTAEFAKTVIDAYYGTSPKLSYFRGCSNGGHEALMEAQKYPDDYDGIIAGAPANSWTHLMATFIWNERALNATPGSGLPDDKLALIQQAVLAQCDGLDGVLDGIVNDPEACHFDPKTLRCKKGDGPDCITQAQLEALRKIYNGPVDPKTHKAIYPGFPAGSEGLPHNWDEWITGAHSDQAALGNQFFGDMEFGNPNWDYRTFDFHDDVAKTDADLGPILNSNDPDMSAFAAHGGKLILFQGWDDAAVTAWGTLQYYRSIEKTMTPTKAHDFVRLFMVPGMMHCFGGPGPVNFDEIAAMEQWKEQGSAPESMLGARIAAATGKPTSTQPICAYPKVAHWTGKGSPADAGNYVCRVPPRTATAVR